MYMALKTKKDLKEFLVKDSRNYQFLNLPFFERIKIFFIVGFFADRAPRYPAIVKDLGGELLRQDCWFHARHYLVDAYLVDPRMEKDVIGFRQEVTSLPRTYRLCSGCWKVAN